MPTVTDPPATAALSQFEQRTGHYHDAEIKIVFGRAEPAVDIRNENTGVAPQPSIDAKRSISSARKAKPEHDVREDGSATPGSNVAASDSSEHDKRTFPLPNRDIDGGLPSEQIPSRQKAIGASEVADTAMSTAREDQTPTRNPPTAPKPPPPKRGGWER